jgi:hypothetical protein
MSKNKTNAEPENTLVYPVLFSITHKQREGWEREFQEIAYGEIERLALNIDKRERDE